jgi:peroxiredoxin
MAQLEPTKPQIEQAGAQLVYIAAEKRGGMFKPEHFLQEHPVTKAYGLYHRLGTDAINIAHPATLVIDGAGTVRCIYRGDTQLDRAPVEQFMEAVKKIQVSGGLSPK